MKTPSGTLLKKPTITSSQISEAATTQKTASYNPGNQSQPHVKTDGPLSGHSTSPPRCFVADIPKAHCGDSLNTELGLPKPHCGDQRKYAAGASENTGGTPENTLLMPGWYPPDKLQVPSKRAVGPLQIRYTVRVLPYRQWCPSEPLWASPSLHRRTGRRG